MAKLLLRMDRDLQVIQRETTFIIYFSCKEEVGVLPLLLQAADKWHDCFHDGACQPEQLVFLQCCCLLLVLDTFAAKHI